MDATIALINRLLEKIDNLEEVNRNIKKYADIQQNRIQENRIDDLKTRLNKEKSWAGSYKKELEKIKEENKRLNEEAIKLLDENMKLKGENTNE